MGTNLEMHASGKTKVEAYGWKKKDSPGKLLMLPKSMLSVDPSYQRVLRLVKVQKICSNWSWVAFGALTVAKRGDGKYYVMEGQHRLEAALRRSDIKELPCIVFELASVAQEAEGFIDANTKRKAVDALSKHLAGLVAKDPRSLRLEAAINGSGLTLLPAQGGTGNAKTIRCISAAYTNLDSVPYEVFTKSLVLCAKLSEKDNVSVDERVLSGLTYLLNKMKGELPEKLESRILARGMTSLKVDAMKASAFFSRGGAKVWAEGILAELNKGLKHKFEI